jgi:hypothetical protein
MTLVETELDLDRVRERVDASRENPEAVAKRWAAAMVKSLFEGLETSSPELPQHVALFAIGESLHHDTLADSAKIHQLTHTNFLNQLNIKPAAVLQTPVEVEQLRLQLTDSEGEIVPDFELVAVIARCPKGEIETIWYQSVVLAQE